MESESHKCFKKRWTNCNFGSCYYSVKSEWVQISNCVQMNKNVLTLQRKEKKQQKMLTKNMIISGNVIHLHYTNDFGKNPQNMWPPLSCKWGDFWPWTWNILNCCNPKLHHIPEWTKTWCKISIFYFHVRPLPLILNTHTYWENVYWCLIPPNHKIVA